MNKTDLYETVFKLNGYYNRFGKFHISCNKMMQLDQIKDQLNYHYSD